MKNILTLIFVHDQKIVLDYINFNKFKMLDNVIYVFVGNKDSTLIESYPNVIISKNLPYNIEQYPKLTSYTGWFSVWKNKLYNSFDYLNLFEYDINLSNNFDKIVKQNLNVDIIGYKPLNVHHINFIKHAPWSETLIQSIKKNYNVNVYDLIDNMPKDKECSVTSNHTFSKKSFENYMEWVSPLIDDIKNLELSGHQIERSISLFYLIKKLKIKLIDDILTHFQFDSHQTQNISQYKFQNEYIKLLN